MALQADGGPHNEYVSLTQTPQGDCLDLAQGVRTVSSRCRNNPLGTWADESVLPWSDVSYVRPSGDCFGQK